MKIEGGRGVAQSGATRRPASAATPGFAPAAEEGPQRVAAPSAAAPLTPLDAIMALQAEGEPGQRRARQARRGRDALDALDRLMQGILTGAAPAGLKAELEALGRGAEATGDQRLDDVLAEIDIRVAVELAKLEAIPGRV
ncbi:MAG: flagellar assembly protein FliX [Hyphomonadaceae bacterium]